MRLMENGKQQNPLMVLMTLVEMLPTHIRYFINMLQKFLKMFLATKVGTYPKMQLTNYLY